MKVPFTRTLTAKGAGGLTVEQVDDRVAALLKAGANVTLTYDDAANTLTIAMTGGGGVSGVTLEQVDDRVASLLQAGSNITLTYDDPTDRLTIAATGGGGGGTVVSGDADSIAFATALTGTTGIDPGINFLRVNGFHVEGDCPPFRVKRVPTATTLWDDYAKWTDGDGQDWEHVVDNGPLYFTQFGPPGDDFSDTVGNACDDHFDAMHAFLYSKSNTSLNDPPLPAVNMSGPEWYFRRPWKLKTATLAGRWTLYGTTASHWGPGVAVRFDTAMTGAGIYIDHNDTLQGAVVASGKGNGGTVIDGILFWCAGGIPGSSNIFRGILQKTRATIRNCQFTGFQGDGIFNYGDIAGGNGGNANTATYENIAFQYNWDSGIKFLGSDCNACIIKDVSFIENYGHSIHDQSFLGNHYYSVHTERTALWGVAGRPVGSVAYNNAVWLCVGSTSAEALASTTPPGTDNNVWDWQYDDATASTYLPTWVSGGSYRSVSTVAFTNYAAANAMWGYYEETGQPRSELIGHKQSIQTGGWHSEMRISRSSDGMLDLDGYRYSGGYTTATLSPLSDTTKGRERMIVELGKGPDQILRFSYGLVGGIAYDNAWNINRVAGTYDFNCFSGKILGTGTVHGTDGTYAGAATALADRSFYLPTLRLGRDPYSRQITYVEGLGSITKAGKGDLFFIESPQAGKAKIVECTVGGNSGGALAFKTVARQEWIATKTGVAPGSLAPGTTSANFEITGVTGAGFANVIWATGVGDMHGLTVTAWTFGDSVYFTIHNPSGNPNGTQNLGTITVNVGLVDLG